MASEPDAIAGMAGGPEANLARRMPKAFLGKALMAEAQKASGHSTKKQTVEEALRLMIRLRRQQDVDSAFGKYRWGGSLARSRKRRGAA